MALDDPPHEGEAHPRAFELVRPVQPAEHLEELVRIRHVEADAVVSDEVDSLVRLEARADFHAGSRSGAAELAGVAEEVGEHLLQQSPVADGRRESLEAHVGKAVAPGLAQLFDHAARQARHVDELDLQCLPAEAGEAQQRVDQLPHPLRVVPDRVQEPLSLGIEGCGVVLEQHLGVAVDRAQWGAQVV